MAAVARYEILDTPPDGAFDRITALAAHLFGTSIAIVSIVDNDRIWFKSHHGLDTEEVGRDPGLCASAILQEGPWVIENAAVDPQALSNPLVAGELGLQFYAGAPLRTHDGYNLGTLCVLDPEPREFSPAQARVLEDLAELVVHELDVRLEARRAVREFGDRERREERLRRDAELLEREARVRTAELEAVIGAVADAFFLVGPDEHVVLANPSARAMLSGANQITGLVLNLADLHGDSPRLTDIVTRGAVELIDRTNSRALEARAYAVPVAGAADAHGDGGGMSILILRDITEQQRLRRIQEALVAMLSHELRTPVSSIYTAAHLLGRNASQRTDEQRQGLIADIAAESERLRRLIEDLLVLTRLDGGDIEIEPEPVQLRHVLGRLIDAERTRWPDHQFVLAVDSDLPPLRAEVTYVEQVVDNLVSNAAKYSDSGTTIELAASRDRDAIEIHVRDQGPGVEPLDRDRLFEIRFRSRTTAHRAPGAGIGLFVCRTLVDAMAGSIRVDARPNGGSDFIVRLPIYEET